MFLLGCGGSGRRVQPVREKRAQRLLAFVRWSRKPLATAGWLRWKEPMNDPWNQSHGLAQSWQHLRQADGAACSAALGRGIGQLKGLFNFQVWKAWIKRKAVVVLLVIFFSFVLLFSTSFPPLTTHLQFPECAR